MPCFVLRSTSLHAYMFRSICFIPYAMFSYALCLSFFLCWCLGLHAHMLDIMSTAMPCLDIHVCMHVLCSYAYVHVSHMLVCLGLRSPMPLCYIYMLRCISICLHAHFHACMCRSVCLHVLISVLYHALCHHLCACMLQAMFMCLTLDLVCHVRCYCSPFVSLLHFLMFWPNG